MGMFSELHDVMDKLENITGAAERLEESFENKKRDDESGMSEYYARQRDRYDKKLLFLILLTAVLWIFFIIATIVLCVQGNDIVLKWLSL